jgi:sialic acid synthase
MREMVIDGRRIADDEPAWVCAEIGHNHGGDLYRAKDMVNTAQQGGASAVKFQMRTPKEVYAPTSEKGAYYYESANPQWMDPVYGKHREALEFTYEQWAELFAHCKKAGITAFATPFDKSSVDRLDSLGVSVFKIASGDATNIPLIKYAASKGKPLIISTGGCNIEDVVRIRRALLNPFGATDPREIPYAILQCSCIYPAPDDIMNLRVIETYREMFPSRVIGLSSHNRRSSRGGLRCGASEVFVLGQGHRRWADGLQGASYCPLPWRRGPSLRGGPVCREARQGLLPGRHQDRTRQRYSAPRACIRPMNAYLTSR